MQTHKTLIPFPVSALKMAAARPITRSHWQTVLSRLRLTTSERQLLLATVDVLILNITLFVFLFTLLGFPLSQITILQQPQYFVILTFLWGVWAAFFNCYDLPCTADASHSAWSAGRAALLTTLTYVAIPYWTPHLPASRLSTYLVIGVATSAILAWRILYTAVFSQPTFSQRLLIVGAGHSGNELARVLTNKPKRGNPYAGSGIQVVGFVDDDPEKVGARIEEVPVLGNRHTLGRLVKQFDIDIIAVAISHVRQIHPELLQALLDCREQNVCLEPMTSLYERLTGRVPVEYAGNDLHVVMPVPDSAVTRILSAGKRLLDLGAGFAGLLVLLVVALPVAVANLISSRGPLFYRQLRVGKGGTHFSVYKFRSMIPEAEKGTGAVWAAENDNRITPVGRFLRKTRLDELPQVINILKGEMSLIGPRPERPEFVTKLVEQVPFYQARHAVRPGLTGWAQVRYRYGSSVEDSLTKLQYDLYYIKHQSVYLEASILVKTAAVVLGRQGR